MKTTPANIDQFVDEHRAVYRECYIKEVLETIKHEEIRTLAYLSRNSDFYGYEICVKMGGPRKPYLWAMNSVQRTEQKKQIGYILINDKLLNESLKTKKQVLTKEWLELMLDFQDPDGRASKHMVSKRLEKRDFEPAEFYEWLKADDSDAIWDDTPTEMRILRKGVLRLLISENTISEVLKTVFNKTLKEVSRLYNNPSGNDEANETATKLRRAIRLFSETRHVHFDVASRRIRYVLRSHARE